jgi:hypothetical protein
VVTNTDYRAVAMSGDARFVTKAELLSTQTSGVQSVGSLYVSKTAMMNTGTNNKQFSIVIILYLHNLPRWCYVQIMTIYLFLLNEIEYHDVYIHHVNFLGICMCCM